MEKRYVFVTESNILTPSTKQVDCSLEDVLYHLYMSENVPFIDTYVIDKITNEKYSEQQSIINLLNQQTPVYRAVVFMDDFEKTLNGFFCTYKSLEEYLNMDLHIKKIELYNHEQKKLVCEGNPITFMSKLDTVLKMSDPLVDINTCVPPQNRVEFDLHEGFTKLGDMIKNGGNCSEMLELLTVLKYFSTKD